MLLDALHPEGLCCPNGHPLPSDQAPHDRHRAPVMDYRCRQCGKVFNVYTGTALPGVRHPPRRLVMILRGFCQGVPTLHLAKDLHASRRHLLDRRHHVQGPGPRTLFPPRRWKTPSSKRTRCTRTRARRAIRTATLTTRRADGPTSSTFNGHGTYDNDRTPILGVIARSSSEVYLQETHRSTRKALQPVVESVTRIDATVMTDEWHAYTFCRRQDGAIPRSVISPRSGHEMTTATACAKSTPTPSKGTGPACGTSFGCSAARTSATWASTSPSTRACTTSRTPRCSSSGTCLGPSPRRAHEPDALYAQSIERSLAARARCLMLRFARREGRRATERKSGHASIHGRPASVRADIATAGIQHS